MKPGFYAFYLFIYLKFCIKIRFNCVSVVFFGFFYTTSSNLQGCVLNQWEDTILLQSSIATLVESSSLACICSLGMQKFRKACNLMFLMSDSCGSYLTMMDLFIKICSIKVASSSAAWDLILYLPGKSGFCSSGFAVWLLDYKLDFHNLMLT